MERKKGLLTLVLSLVARQIAITVSPIALGAEAEININPEGAALIVGMLTLLLFATKEKPEEDESVDLTSVFSDRVKRIKEKRSYFNGNGRTSSCCYFLPFARW